MKFNPLKVMMVLCLTVLFNSLNAQTIQGSVVSTTNESIQGVSIFLKTEKLAETNAEGIFALSDTLRLPIKVRLEHPEHYISEVEITQSNLVFHLAPLSSFENLQEVLLSSAVVKDSIGELIIPTAKITAKMLETHSPIDLVSAINETPGVFMQSGAINTNRITIRGIGSRTLYGTNKIRAYFNGIPITDGGGETTIDMFDPESLESIEIIKGPKASKYGTNLGGTLLLNSKQASVGESFLNSNITVGSFGLIKNTVSVATSTKKFSINLNYDHLQTEGFRENNDYDRKAFLLTSNYKFNPKNEIALMVNYIDYFAQIPSSIGKTAFEEDPSQAATTWKEAKGYEDNRKTLTGLSYTHRFSENFSNTSNVFYTYLDHYEPRPFDILDEFTNGYGVRTVFYKDFIFLKNRTNLSFGGEFYKDEYNWKTIENLYQENHGNGSLEGDLLSDSREQRDNLNVFVAAAIPFSKKLTGQFGLNFNKTQYRFKDEFNTGGANTSANRDFKPIFAPNINLLYEFHNDWNVFVNFSRGFNYPSIEETLTPEGIINPELGPEKGFNYEMGSELFLFQRKLHFQGNIYLLDIDDLLVAERVGDDEYVGRNAGKTIHKGIEFQLSFFQPIPDFGYVSPYINAEFTDHKFIDFVDGDTDYSGNQLTGVPDKKVSGGINFGYNKWVLNTNFLHIGVIPLNDANELYSEKYTILNIKTTYKTELSKFLSLEINAGVNNFTDEKYAASVLINATGFGNSEPRFYYPGRPRNWFGGIKVMYRW